MEVNTSFIGHPLSFEGFRASQLFLFQEFNDIYLSLFMMKPHRGSLSEAYIPKATTRLLSTSPFLVFVSIDKMATQELNMKIYAVLIIDLPFPVRSLSALPLIV